MDRKYGSQTENEEITYLGLNIPHF
jgi:hypothetical protein